MAWVTTLAVGEELVIDGRVVVRVVPGARNAQLVLDDVPGAERLPIVKRPRSVPAGGK